VLGVVVVVIGALVVGRIVELTRPVHHYSGHAHRQGWKSGVFAGYTAGPDEAFAKWRGAAIQTATDFVSSGSWTQIAHPLSVKLAWRQDHAVQLVLSVPMWPDTGGSFGEVAAGTDNEYFRGLAATLVGEKRDDTVIRLGWEFNTPFFRWQVKTPAEARQYAEGWRQVVRSMRSVAGQHFQFVWNPDLADQGINPALAYPGDAYVDDIGLDVYDRSQRPGQNPTQRWDALVHQRFGLQWHASFAAAHHKPVAFPEWGLVQDPGSPTDGGDDPTFVRQMHAWFASHHTAFENYFNGPSPDGGNYTINGGAFPKSAAVYRQLFGTGHP
jgi:hypothetical protein